MTDLTTRFAGLTLQNPLIIGSSGLTNHPDNIAELEKQGAAAVVLKSLFEEQIMAETEETIRAAYQHNLIYTQKSDAFDYIDMSVKEDTIAQYLELIRESKKRVSIPVIASVNCVTASEWTSFVNKIQTAGADAIELNIAITPTDVTQTIGAREKIHNIIFERVKTIARIPVIVKLSPYFTNPALVINSLSEAGADGLVLFNRYYNPDFDIETMTEKSANTYSRPDEYSYSLRWIAIMSGKVGTGLSAATGIHNTETIIKQLLAGAQTVQLVSAIYKEGPGYIQTLLKELEQWMDQKGFNQIDQFRARLCTTGSINQGIFDRIQFMKYFSNIG